MKKQIAALTLALAASIFSMSAMATDSDHQGSSASQVMTSVHDGDEQLDYKEWGKAPTCTEPGIRYWKCVDPEFAPNDGKMYVHIETVPATGHDKLGGTVVTKYPTCKTPGTATYTCSKCKTQWTGEIKIEDMSNQEDLHDWEAWTVTKAATCFKEGEQVRWCKLCSAVQTEKIPKLKAKWVETKTLKDCYHVEYTYKCAYCGSELDKDEYGKPIPNSYAHADEDLPKRPDADVVAHDIPHDAAHVLNPFKLTSGNTVNPTCVDEGYILYYCDRYFKNGVEEAAHVSHANNGKGNVLKNAKGEVIYTYYDGVDVVAVPKLGHDWGEWKCQYAPTETKTGLWTRTCKRAGCNHSEQYAGMTAPTADQGGTEVTPPAKKNGLYKDADGVYRHYTDGKVDTFTGIAPFQGGEFFVANGVLCANANGLNQNVDGKWYFLSQGQIQKVSQTVSYGKDYFQVTNGELDVNYNGIHDYDGGKFLFAAGKLRTDVQGLWQAADGTWYFLANGQVQTQYKGLALYDGKWFYVDGGKFDPTFAGKVEHDGKTFDVVNGQVF